MTNLKRLSPLRYPGGKVKVLNFIIELIKQNNCIASEYVEPYAGGAGVALGLLIGGHVSKIHINDIDLGIYNFWLSILNETENFIKQIEKVDINTNEWNKQRLIYNNLDNHSPLECGFATFFLNRCNRSGIITAGCIGGKNQNGNYKIDARFNKKDLIRRIEQVALYKNKIELYNQDTFSLIQENKESFKNMILYLDPPYYVKGACLYKNSYKHNDHVKIKEALKEINGNWIVSYDNVPEIVDIYDGILRKEFSINYSAGRIKKGKEIMFFSDNLVIPDLSII